MNKVLSGIAILIIVGLILSVGLREGGKVNAQVDEIDISNGVLVVIDTIMGDYRMVVDTQWHTYFVYGIQGAIPMPERELGFKRVDTSYKWTFLEDRIIAENKTLRRLLDSCWGG